MIEFLLFVAICAILYLVLAKKNEKNNPRSAEEELLTEINSLKSKLCEKNAEHKDREHNFNRTIQDLQLSISKQQDITKINNLQLQKKQSDLALKNQELENKLNEETVARKKVLSQKKSGEVRLGHIAETLAPFLDQFDFEPEECSFLGQPIDYISFGDDEITFIEVKSGNSQLSKKQRHIRDLVKAKLVSWKEVRIK